MNQNTSDNAHNIFNERAVSFARNSQRWVSEMNEKKENVQQKLRNTRFRRAFLDNLSRLDMFGKQITLTFQGNDKFQTPVGAFFSIICGLLIFSYAVKGLQQYLQGTILSLNTQSLFTDLSTGLSFDPSQYGFKLAVGIKGLQIDPTYGYLKFEKVEKGRKIPTVKSEINTEKCSDQQQDWMSSYLSPYQSESEQQLIKQEN